MQLNGLRYVAVEGPIGVGKTSLARLLAERLGAELLLEAPADNPFLAKFYTEPVRYALPTQLTFLFQRADQVKSLAQLSLFQRVVIADFMLDKDPLFAQLTLGEDELALYRKLYAQLQPQSPHPDLVIVLQASPHTLVSRVQQRGIRYEQSIGADYLARLADAYTQFFHRYDAAPVLFVNTDGLNFVDNREHFDWLLRRVGDMHGAREFFNADDHTLP